ncbi:hypothetical protein LZ016_10660 [Sphingomonas sp. SM33]|jgi:hypothetical protein|uniref:Lipoprotein n=1 Tax=Sphingomonas telluris TaxID=2907998 RepID=A0ABS9VNK5_9SPHN|nr:hypothetical protein [Sphingomonas telluris]MCH8616558.1 hypothetical protein [Sphingomonas telluris]
MRRGFALVALPLALAACDTIAPDLKPAYGHFGGPQVGVVLEGGSGKVDFDCASGTVDEPIFDAKEGVFSVKGTYRTGHSGQIKVGQIFRSQPATYSGTLVKDDMMLTVTLEDGEVLGPYKLQRGVPPQLTRCPD